MSPVLGLVMMSTLADVCAGSMKRTVTDQHAAYATVRATVATTAAIVPDTAATHRLVDVTLRVANLEHLPLADLVELRRREKREAAGSDLTKFRRHLAARIDTTAQAMARATPTDRKTLQSQFEQDMADDLARLSRDLRNATWNVMFSKELALGLLIGVGLLAVPFAEALGGAFALVGMQRAYRRERLEAFERHPMSWLHLQQ